MNWTRRSQNDEPTGCIRISVPESKSNKFPSRLRIFGEAVFVQRIRPRDQPVVCTKCHGFHTARKYARNPKCKTFSSDLHDGPCIKPIRCLNCCGPYTSDDKNFPARPRRINGVFVRPTGAKLHQIRTAGGREFAKTNPQSTLDSSQLSPSSLATESLVSSQ
ncbi:putative effector protein [Erysiphe necator]|uniref:Putative effector protein n=1 Tax=Uncinula necator TaxID=52586 RepID=A0A0B1P3W2_UNCNE|nr:putative effector protein [Erysiphe necator]